VAASQDTKIKAAKQALDDEKQRAKKQIQASTERARLDVGRVNTTVVAEIAQATHSVNRAKVQQKAAQGRLKTKQANAAAALKAALLASNQTLAREVESFKADYKKTSKETQIDTEQAKVQTATLETKAAQLSAEVNTTKEELRQADANVTADQNDLLKKFQKYDDAAAKQIAFVANRSATQTRKAQKSVEEAKGHLSAKMDHGLNVVNQTHASGAARAAAEAELQRASAAVTLALHTQSMISRLQSHAGARASDLTTDLERAEEKHEQLQQKYDTNTALHLEEASANTLKQTEKRTRVLDEAVARAERNYTSAVQQQHFQGKQVNAARTGMIQRQNELQRLKVSMLRAKRKNHLRVEEALSGVQEENASVEADTKVLNQATKEANALKAAVATVNEKTQAMIAKSELSFDARVTAAQQSAQEAMDVDSAAGKMEQRKNREMNDVRKKLATAEFTLKIANQEGSAKILQDSEKDSSARTAAMISVKAEQQEQMRVQLLNSKIDSMTKRAQDKVNTAKTKVEKVAKEVHKTALESVQAGAVLQRKTSQWQAAQSRSNKQTVSVDELANALAEARRARLGAQRSLERKKIATDKALIEQAHTDVEVAQQIAADALESKQAAISFTEETKKKTAAEVGKALKKGRADKLAIKKQVASELLSVRNQTSTALHEYQKESEEAQQDQAAAEKLRETADADAEKMLSAIRKKHKEVLADTDARIQQARTDAKAAEAKAAAQKDAADEASSAARTKEQQVLDLQAREVRVKVQQRNAERDYQGATQRLKEAETTMSRRVRLAKVKVVAQKQKARQAQHDSQRATKASEEQEARTQIEESQLETAKRKLAAAKIAASEKIKQAQDHASAVERIVESQVEAERAAAKREENAIRDQADTKLLLVKQQQDAEVTMASDKVPVEIQRINSQVQTEESKADQEIFKYNELRTETVTQLQEEKDKLNAAQDLQKLYEQNTTLIRNKPLPTLDELDPDGNGWARPSPIAVLNQWKAENQTSTIKLHEELGTALDHADEIGDDWTSLEHGDSDY